MRTADATLAEPLPDDEIHLWRLDYERSQGRAPLLRLLGRYLALAPQQVMLTQNAHGRPQLPQRPALHFNWSHSGDCALVAVARSVQPGVDVERLRPRPQAMALSRRYFAPEEAATLASLPAADRERGFLAYWTAKEAVLKALGRGIAFGLHRLTLQPAAGGLRLAELAGDDARQWQLRPVELGPDHLAAVAWRGGAHRLRLRTLSQATDA